MYQKKQAKLKNALLEFLNDYETQVEREYIRSAVYSTTPTAGSGYAYIIPNTSGYVLSSFNPIPRTYLSLSGNPDEGSDGDV